MLASAVCVSAANLFSDGTGTSESVPAYCLELNSPLSPGPSRTVEPTPLMFATQIAPLRGSLTIAPGNQPTGIKPRHFDPPGLKPITATAFCEPLHAKSVLPDLSKARASGCAPNKSDGFCRVLIVSTTRSARASMTLKVSLPALATTTWRLSGDRASAEA